jgi:RNA methyltransferase, TrmH family
MQTAAHDRLRRISSRQNTLVKELRRAFQHGTPTDDGYCAIESVHLIEEAIRSGLRFRDVFFSASAEARAHKLLPQLAAHVETLLLPDDVFANSVSTESPQGVAALVRYKDFTVEDALAGTAPLVVVAVGIQDPGNMGTIIRSAEAFGATGVLATEKTVSRFNPKVVRASAGSIFRLPVVQAEAKPLLAELRGRGLRLVATSSHKGTPLPEAALGGPLALFIGSEGAGLPREVMGEIDETVAIPHSPRVESLNAGVAASIALYEVARQRSSN